MGLLRRALLAASQSRWLRERAMRREFVRRAVSRFMPGEEVGDALEAAARLRSSGMDAVLTRLGENVTDESEADAVAAHYLDLLSRVAAERGAVEISVKPTQLGLDLDEGRCGARLRTLAERAQATGNFVWIDMEQTTYADATLRLCRLAREGGRPVGVCLQAYLRRTAADLERLRPLDPAIRLVKGAYDEPAAIAYRDKRQVDASYLGLAVSFLKEGRGRPIRLGLGTHDVALIEQIAAQVAPAGIGREGFEIEMLYGIRTGEQFRLAKAGYRVQVLIAYGDAWYPWYMRRLAERPANVTFAIRSLLP